MISDRFWRHELAASPSVLGSTLMLDGQVFEIVGLDGTRHNFTSPMRSGLAYSAKTRDTCFYAF